MRAFASANVLLAVTKLCIKDSPCLAVLQEEKAEPQVKAALVGGAGTGKTCLVTRIQTDEYVNNLMPTGGASFSFHDVTLGAQTIRFNIWDCAGDPAKRSIVQAYSRGCAVAIVAFDVTVKKSLGMFHRQRHQTTADAELRLCRGRALVASRTTRSRRHATRAHDPRRMQDRPRFAEKSHKGGNGPRRAVRRCLRGNVSAHGRELCEPLGTPSPSDRRADGAEIRRSCPDTTCFAGAGVGSTRTCRQPGYRGQGEEVLSVLRNTVNALRRS